MLTAPVLAVAPLLNLFFFVSSATRVGVRVGERKLQATTYLPATASSRNVAMTLPSNGCSTAIHKAPKFSSRVMVHENFETGQRLLW
jgi:hypothetical protein